MMFNYRDLNWKTWFRVIPTVDNYMILGKTVLSYNAGRVPEVDKLSSLFCNEDFYFIMCLWYQSTSGGTTPFLPPC